jgi:hypothetical protein
MGQLVGKSINCSCQPKEKRRDSATNYLLLPNAPLKFLELNSPAKRTGCINLSGIQKKNVLNSSGGRLQYMAAYSFLVLHTATHHHVSLIVVSFQ